MANENTKRRQVRGPRSGDTRISKSGLKLYRVYGRNGEELWVTVPDRDDNTNAEGR